MIAMRPAARTNAQLRARPRGQALVEFALVVPVLMVIFLGMIDLGRAYYAGVVTEQAAREGARLGMNSSPGTGVVATTADCAGVQANADCTPIKSQVLNALGLGTGGTNYLGINAANVNVFIGGYESDGTSYGHFQGAAANVAGATCPARCPGGQVQVEVRYDLPLYTQFLVGKLGFNSINVRGYATATIF